MTPALWGLLTAVSWGSADFIARFTGRALGPRTALLAMLGVGAVVFSLLLWRRGVVPVLDPAGWWLLLLSGVGIMTATLLFYWGLARGPVTVVAPLAATYPALNVALAVVLGVRPSTAVWVAMAAVILGVVVVARSARSFEDPVSYPRARLRRTIVIALAAAFTFALAIAATQEAALIYGELETLWLGRWIGLFACALLFLPRREVPRIPGRWWPLLILQGLLDGGAYAALLAGSHGATSQIAVVVASGFGAVTVLLAWMFLREAMTWTQWGGIAMIVGGVALLSGSS